VHVTQESPLHLPAIAILGAGSMGRAILQGLLSPHVHVASGIRITNRRVESAAEFATEPRVSAWVTSDNEHANREAVRGASVVIVAVKPADIEELVADVAADLDDDAVVVSVAAGKTLAQLQAAAGATRAVMRAMPNTPAQIRRGVTGIAVGQNVSAAQRDLVESVFATVGSVVVVDEERLNALTSISGSGPAYVFYLIEQWEQAARELGFTHDEAALLVRETVRGAAELVLATGEQPEELRRRVTSPQGTTERAVGVLQQANLAEVFETAMQAAMARAREIAAGD
jgi:pyrroline-5-carboxylate reductase